MVEDDFLFAPVEVAIDNNLTLDDTKVLLALFASRDSATNLVWPASIDIVRFLDMPLWDVEASLFHLRELGWVEDYTDKYGRVTSRVRVPVIARYDPRGRS